MTQGDREDQWYTSRNGRERGSSWQREEQAPSYTSWSESGTGSSHRVPMQEPEWLTEARERERLRKEQEECERQQAEREREEQERARRSETPQSRRSKGPGSRPRPSGRAPRDPRAHRRRVLRAWTVRIAVAVVLLAAVLLLVGIGRAIVQHLPMRSQSQSAQVQRGLSWLEKQENTDVASVREEIQDVQKTLKAQKASDVSSRRRQAYQATLANGQVWGALKNAVLLGDSRVLGFSVFHFLPQKRVLAEGGGTINKVAEYTSKIQKINPRYIFLSYGINDVGIGIWKTPADYAQAMHSVLKALHKKFPGVQIYVNSMLPAQPSAIEKSPAWANIPQYSAALKEMCEKYGYPFIDNDDIVSAHSNLYDTDGVHLQPDFYQYWGENLAMAIYDQNNQ